MYFWEQETTTEIGSSQLYQEAYGFGVPYLREEYLSLDSVGICGSLLFSHLKLVSYEIL